MASVDYGVLANDILQNVGGEGNVAKVVHCATRLRFVLKDATKAGKKTIEALPGVITVMEAGGSSRWSSATTCRRRTRRCRSR